MIKIEVRSADLRQIPFTYKSGQKAGQAGTMHKQEAWAFLVDSDGKPQPYPQRINIEIDVAQKQAAWPVGVYQLAPSTVFVGKYGDLVFGRVHLLPLSQSALKAA